MMSRYFLTILVSYFSIAISFELPLLNEADFNHQVKPNINFNNNISNFALDKTIDKNNYNAFFNLGNLFKELSFKNL